MKQLSLPYLEAPEVVRITPAEQPGIAMEWVPEVDTGTVIELLEGSTFTFPSPKGSQPNWITSPLIAFEDWQRNTTSSEGKHYSARSILQHCAMWRRFVEFMAKHQADVKTVSTNQIAVFLDGMRGREDKPAEDSTKQRYLKLLSATFEQICRVGVRTGGNPCARLDRFNRRNLDLDPTSLASSDDEKFVQLVLSVAPTNWREARDQAMLVLIVASGLYSSEIIHLKMQDLALDAEPPYVHVPAHGKVPERLAPISAFAIKPLRNWLSYRDKMPLGEDAVLFISGKGGHMRAVTLYRKVRDILKSSEANMRSYGGNGPQVLRNSFLVRQLAHDNPIEVVQQWVGHVEAKSTARFKRLIVNPGGVRVA